MNGDVYESAQQGDPEAQYQLGERYSHFELIFDVYVEKDYEEAAKWYKKAAEQNYVEAQYKLGEIYGRGEEAMKWYKKAAEQNHAEAQYKLAWMCTNERDAVKWYRKAAEQNHDEALVSLARMYKRGEGGVPEDYAEAVKLYWKATALGNSEACGCLAHLYRNGVGVPKDEGIAGELEHKANVLFAEASAKARTRRRPRPQLEGSYSNFSGDSGWVHTAQIVFATLVVVGALRQCVG